MNIPKALYDVLGDASDWFVLYRTQTPHHLFNTIWEGLTYVSLGLGLVLDFGVDNSHLRCHFTTQNMRSGLHSSAKAGWCSELSFD